MISPGKTSQLERGNRPKQHTKSRSNDDKIQHEPTEHIREKKAKRYTKWKKKKAKISKGDNLLSNHKLYFPSCLNQINESWDTARCEKWYLIEIMDHRNSDPLRESFAPALIYNSIFLISTDDSSEKWPEALKVAGNLASHGGGEGFQTSVWFWYHCCSWSHLPENSSHTSPSVKLAAKYQSQQICAGITTKHLLTENRD